MEEAFAQIKTRKLRKHLPKALGGGFVKAIQGLGLLYALGVYALRATVAQATALGTAAAACFGLGQVLLHRATGHKLDDHKGQQQHPQQSGHHEQQAFEGVQQHGLFKNYGSYFAHQVSMAQVSPWA